MSIDFPFPVLSTSGDRVESELSRLRRDGLGTGSVPVIIGTREDALRLTELLEGPFDVNAEIAAASRFSPDAWFAERREEDEEYNFDDSQSEIHPEGTAPMTRLTIGFDHRNRPHREIFIATISTDDPSVIPAHLRFGGWNSCPSPHVHIGLARYWGERFGAQIATIASDRVEFTVERPPTNDAEALDLAWQQYLYCADIVEQGVESVATLAKALRRSTRWYFWWD